MLLLLTVVDFDCEEFDVVVPTRLSEDEEDEVTVLLLTLLLFCKSELSICLVILLLIGRAGKEVTLLLLEVLPDSLETLETC